MPYGQTKMSSTQAVEGILDAIKSALLKNDAFSSNSIGYYGIELEFKVNLKLHSRGYAEAEVNGTTTVGPEDDTAALTDKDPKQVTVEGRKIAGRVPGTVEERRVRNAAVKAGAGESGPKTDK